MNQDAFRHLQSKMVQMRVSCGLLLCRVEGARDLSPVKVLINRSCKAFLSSSRLVILI